MYMFQSYDFPYQGNCKEVSIENLLRFLFPQNSSYFTICRFAFTYYNPQFMWGFFDIYPLLSINNPFKKHENGDPIYIRWCVDLSRRLDNVRWHWLCSTDQFGFGKHSGKTIKEVYETDPTYIYWCINTIDGFLIHPSFFKIDRSMNNAIDINYLKFTIGYITGQIDFKVHGAITSITYPEDKTIEYDSPYDDFDSLDEGGDPYA